jgi:hypothetical protein
LPALASLKYHLYVYVILSPSKSTAPSGAHVNVAPVFAVRGDNVAAFTVGAVLAIVTILDFADSLLEAVPSFAITAQDKLSPTPGFADVKVLPVVGPYTTDFPKLASLKYHLYVYVILSPSKSTAPSGAHVNVVLIEAVFGDNNAPRTVGAVFEIVTIFDEADSTLISVPSSAKTVQ